MIEIPEHAPLLFSQRQIVRWGDMDAYRHVNNVMYFRYLEECRISWLAAIGLGIEPESQAQGPVLASTACDYLRSIVYPAEMEICILGGKVGNSSFTVYQVLADASDPALWYAKSRSVSVWIDYRSGRSVALPEPLRQSLLGQG